MSIHPLKSTLRRAVSLVLVTAFAASSTSAATLNTLVQETQTPSSVTPQQARQSAQEAQSLVNTQNALLSLQAASTASAVPPLPATTTAIKQALQTQTASSPSFYSGVKYNAQGRVSGYTVTNRDFSGRVVSILTYGGISYTAAGAVNGFMLTKTDAYTYNTANQDTGFTVTVVSKSGTISSVTIESGIAYNYLGQRTTYKRVVKNGSGAVISSIEYSDIGYDFAGKTAVYAEVARTSGGDISSKRFFDVRSGTKQLYKAENWSGGRVAAATEYYTGTGILSRITRYSYDSAGKLTQTEIRSYQYGTLLIVTFYDGSMRQKRVENYAGGVLSKVALYVYEGAAIGRVDELNAQQRLVTSWIYDLNGLAERISWNPATGKMETRDYFHSPKVCLGQVVARRLVYDAAEKLVRIDVFGTTGLLVKTYGPDAVGSLESINAWHLRQQGLTGTGLIASHPDDMNFIYHEGNVAEWAKIYAYTQAYTYDEAVNAMALLDGGNVAAAKRIFDFYYAEWQKEGANFSGFWSVYNVDPAFQWKRYEWRKEMGANSWMALFALRYSAASADPAERARGQALAVAIGKWAASLPRHQGAIAMTSDNPGGNPNFGRVYSTEFNIDFYSLAKTLSTRAATQADRDFFAAQAALVGGWLKTQAWDPAKGLFKRGGTLQASGAFTWDPLWTLDKNVWAIQAIGVEALKTDFGIDADALLLNVEKYFMVRDDGAFDADVRRASGFDFGDAANAALIGRAGMKWVEGTNQVIVAYRVLAEYHAGKGSAQKAAYYKSRADYFESRNADNAIVSNGAVSYTYADKAGVQLYWNTGNWKTFAGSSGASTPWVYFAKKGLNPFSIPQ